jgi:hypothetical protein
MAFLGRGKSMEKVFIRFMGLMAQQLIGTTFIDAIREDGLHTWGSGFFYLSDNGIFLITNRHVMAGALDITIAFHTGPRNSPDAITGVIHCDIENVQGTCVYHENDRVDLCAVPLSGFLSGLETADTTLRVKYFDKTAIRDDDNLSYLGAINDIYMVGFPDGLFDTHRCYPIVRKGITASVPFLDFENEVVRNAGVDSVFLIDMPVFPGSSGSPVLLFKENRYLDGEEQEEKTGGKFLLLGVASSTYLIKDRPNVITIDRTGNFCLRPTDVPSNLGFAVRAKEIKALSI